MIPELDLQTGEFCLREYDLEPGAPGSNASVSTTGGRILLTNIEAEEVFGGFDVGDTLAINGKSGSRAFQAVGRYFIRGDVNGDQGVNIADSIGILVFLFGNADWDCLAALDVNDDSLINVSDVVFLLVFLFNDGPTPPEPFFTPGLDRTPQGADFPCL